MTDVPTNPPPERRFPADFPQGKPSVPGNPDPEIDNIDPSGENDPGSIEEKF